VKPVRSILTVTLLLAGLGATGAALAYGGHGHGHGHGGHHGGHASLGLYFGVPLATPYYYPPAYYYPPRYYYPAPVVVTPAAPTYYLQQDTPPPPAAGYWYYCRDPQGYYPQVQQCPTPWQQVPAQPSTQ
jgi:hypothetical protein